MKNLRTSALVAASAIALGLISIAPAFATDPIGTWLTGDKKGKVKIVNCGGAICGTLTWLAEPNDPQTNKPTRIRIAGIQQNHSTLPQNGQIV